ncbi:MAG: hypothetical protein ABS43_06365 [Bordetella sp. SCN 67-23]|nr:hypothetical protein [Burkholderiales bacterium]ODS75222.1 MAG: hypothetical protein ABS43_06365 [Bordetella sp. SCN 67-23]OJW93373.1 MAG: hypothetical protein BGO71_15410 [Burkholderiales bacterium 67-32]
MASIDESGFAETLYLAVRRVLDALAPDKLERTHELAVQCVDEVLRDFGGSSVYVPKNILPKLDSRNQEIAKLFNGRNVREIAHRFGLSDMRVRQIIKAARVRKRLDSLRETRDSAESKTTT